MSESISNVGVLDYNNPTTQKVQETQKTLIERHPNLAKVILCLTMLAGAAGLSGDKEKPAFHLDQGFEEVGNMDKALANIHDPEFLAKVHQHREELNRFIFAHPKDAQYIEDRDVQSVDNGFDIHQKAQGKLTESGSDLELASSSVSKMYEKYAADDKTEASHDYEGVKSFFIAKHLTPSAHIETGGTFIQKGEGHSEEQAIENALKNAVEFFGVNIVHDSESRKMTESAVSNNKDTIKIADTIDTSTRVDSKHVIIKSYKVTDHTAEPDEFIGGKSKIHRVSVEVVVGVPQENHKK